MACGCSDSYVHEDFLNLPLRCFLVTMSEDERPTGLLAKKRFVLGNEFGSNESVHSRHAVCLHREGHP